MDARLLLQQQQEEAMREYFRRCREAEQYRAVEVHAAVVLQAAWRGCLQRQELDRLRRVATTIQKCWRGYLGRRRFAAALAAHNTQLRQAYFDHHATVIQKHWRGHFSRSRIHDFYRRQAFLRSVAAANGAVKAGMQAELQAALEHRQQEAHAAAQQHFTQVSKLHYLSSTASIPGIFSSQPVASAAGQASAPCYTAAGQPLEQHLRAAVKHKAAAAVKQQQAVLRRALGNTQQGGSIFPAGVPVPAPDTALAADGECTAGAATCPKTRSSASRLPAKTSAQLPPQSSSTGSTAAAVMAAASAGSGGVGGSSRGSSRGSSQKLQEQKLAHGIVESCVDQVFASRAVPNMPDGRSFNPGLSLQQSTDYEAVQEAADLGRRLERGLMLVLHQGQPFIPIAGKLEQGASGEPPPASAEGRRVVAAAAAADDSSSQDAVAAAQRLPWRHNQRAGGMFDRHAKQVY